MNARPCLYAAAAAALLSAVSPSARAQEVFEMDPSHFSVIFSVSHNNMSYTYGMFRTAQGQVVLDRADPTGCQFQLTIDADSIDTNHPGRDQHLKRDDFLNTAQFPTIAFKSTACTLDSRQEGKVYLVTGNLTMHGVTKPLTLAVKMLGEGPGPGGRGYSAGFITQVELKRSDYGMGNMTNAVGDAIGITVSFEAIRQDGATSRRG